MQLNDMLTEGVAEVDSYQKHWQEEDDYLRGKHEKPFAPEGVSAEYEALREMAVAPWLRLVARAPVQRLRVDGFRGNDEEDNDLTTWHDVWQANRLDARQRIVYLDGIVHGRGYTSVWPNRANSRRPVISVESPRNVMLRRDPLNPFESLWGVKTTPAERFGSDRKLERVAFVYTPEQWARYEATGHGRFYFREGGANPLGAVPFVEFAPEMDGDGQPQSMLRPLFPMQRAIDTIRFDLLLSAQFAAYRQRIVTGFDPIMYDNNGEPIQAKNPDGSLRFNPDGSPAWMMHSVGRPGVDRLLAFPGEGSKVFDLPESNLKNYIEVISTLVQQLAAISQTPPQYLLGNMANLSGEALAAAESTLVSLVRDLQRSYGESWEETIRLAHIARGTDHDEVASEVVWADEQARAFSQTVDGIQKLVSIGFPMQAGFEMLPGATSTKVKRWMDMSREEATDQFLSAVVNNALSNENDSSGTAPEV